MRGWHLAVCGMQMYLAAVSVNDFWPFVVLAVSVGFIMLAIGKLKLHPFIALILAALFVGILARFFPGSTDVKGVPDITSVATLGNVLTLTLKGFGDTAGGIAISIGLASVIGFCLMESGGADRVVRWFLGIFGEKRAGLALVVSSYILSIPIFFDTMFLLMAPLAQALYLRTGKNYLLYILCVCAGAVVTHSLTVPHPGPIAAVGTLGIDTGFSIIAGIICGIIPAAVGYLIAKVMDGRMTIPLRETPAGNIEHLQAIIGKPVSELPSLGFSLVPVLLPIALIMVASFLKVAETAFPAVASIAPVGSVFREIIDFTGDKNIALLIGAFCAIQLVAQQKKWKLSTVGQTLSGPLETAGIIILITSAGGAFGYMIRNAGVGGAVSKMSEGMGLNLILLAYLMTFIVRVAQGSATVAMITGSAIMLPLIGGDLGYNSIYIYLAIGFGSFACSWMNDSGFWVVSRLSGMTEQETLKTFTVMLTLISLSGLVVTLIASKILPLI